MSMRAQDTSLLCASDPEPVEWVNKDSRAEVLLLCEHAGQAIPEALGDLGLPEGALDTHIGWDIGAEALAKGVAARLSAPLILQRYSRLVIDCNRPVNTPQSIPAVSDGTFIAKNWDAEDDERRARERAIFAPLDAAIEQGFAGAQRRAAFSIHSFTPEMGGVSRPWHAGFLSRHDVRTASALVEHVKNAAPELTLAINQPYQIDAETDWFIPAHAEPRNMAHSLIEIRNDQLRDRTDIARWVGSVVKRNSIRFGGFSMTPTRDVPLQPAQSALLFIDVQNFAAHRDGGEFKDLPKAEFEEKYGWFFSELDARVIPNMQAIQVAARSAGVEVMYTTIESLTLDGRDRSLDYKITGFNVPKGSWDGKVIDQIAPKGDEIVLPKSSSSVFVSTHIDYILRNLGVRQVVLSGLITDQCVESAIRDACDLGYLVTQVTDACLTYSRERHENSLQTIKGYCRQVTTEELVAELSEARPS